MVPPPAGGGNPLASFRSVLLSAPFQTRIRSLVMQIQQAGNWPVFMEVEDGIQELNILLLARYRRYQRKRGAAITFLKYCLYAHGRQYLRRLLSRKRELLPQCRQVSDSGVSPFAQTLLSQILKHLDPEQATMLVNLPLGSLQTTAEQMGITVSQLRYRREKLREKLKRLDINAV